MPMPLVKPTINLNGQTKERHIEQRLTVRAHLLEAMDAMMQLSPHGRDYPQDDGRAQLETDRALHAARMKYLDDLYTALEQEAVLVMEQ